MSLDNPAVLTLQEALFGAGYTSESVLVLDVTAGVCLVSSDPSLPRITAIFGSETRNTPQLQLEVSGSVSLLIGHPVFASILPVFKKHFHIISTKIISSDGRLIFEIDYSEVNFTSANLKGILTGLVDPSQLIRILFAYGSSQKGESKLGDVPISDKNTRRRNKKNLRSQ